MPDSRPSPARSGIPGLDEVLGGGFPRHRLYLLQGDPGVGKTTVGLQFLLQGAKEGEQGLYVTLSETAEELQAVARSHGWSLDGITIHEVAIPGELAPAEDNTLFHPAEVELGETVRALLEEVERLQPSRVIIDSLSEIRLLSQSAFRYRRQILALKQFFAGRNCTVILLDDNSADNGDMHLQSIAHGVLRLEQLAPLYGAERRRLRIMKLRGVKFRGGFHDVKIETGALVVFPRLVASEHPGAFTDETVSTGIGELDALLGGGIHRGTTTLLMGPAGTGKSIIAAQCASAFAARGEKAVLFTLDEGTGTLFKRAKAMGIPLSPHVESGRLVVKQVDPAELSPGEFAHLVRDAIDGGARMVVLDSLNGYYNAMPEESFLSLQLHELFSYLRHKGVIVLLTIAQHGFMGPMTAPVDVSYLADTVVLLRYFEADSRVRKAISILKQRSGSHETAIRELILEGGLAIGSPLAGFRGIMTGVPVYTSPAASGRTDAEP